MCSSKNHKAIWSVCVLCVFSVFLRGNAFFKTPISMVGVFAGSIVGFELFIHGYFLG